MVDMPHTNDYRTRLLASLGSLLERQSLLDITIADIVREARVSKRTFYEQFPNKEDCFVSLFRQHADILLDIVGSALAVPGLALEARLEHGFRTFLTTLTAQARLLSRLYIDILSLGATGIQVREEANRQFAGLLAHTIEADRERLPGLHIDEQMLLCVVTGVNELVLYRIEQGEIASLPDLTPTAQRLLAGALHEMLRPVSREATVGA
ncbi:MAG: TetR family transcriptional regulator [Moraxellaceae bacterium]|jgi:AcrR family transcriptional regulator|nr:TetR family transcriptional regulator [Moraxellaceae bacterium]